jgi:galactoside O-acetyltransferase
MPLPHFINTKTATIYDEQPVSTCKNCGSKNFIMENGKFKAVGKTPDAEQNLFECADCGWQGIKYEIIQPYEKKLTYCVRSNFYEQFELNNFGFIGFGKNVLISKKCSIYNPEKILLGNNVRIDDFCILSAGEHGIKLGDYIHIAAYSSLIGKGPIYLRDYSNISSRVSIYSSSDDYSGMSMTNPMVPEEFTNVTHGRVYIGKHVIIGSGSVVLSNTILGENSAYGALSMMQGIYKQNSIYAGVPAKYIKHRSTNLFELEKKLKEKHG